jgi:hypothetical protein
MAGCYPGRKAAAELLGRLADAPAGLTGPEGEVRATVTLGLVAALDTVRAQIDELEGEVIKRLAPHADAAIFTALPRSGRVRAAALLAEIGDCRARFPDAESLTCLAGAAPSIRRSGKHKQVVFHLPATRSCARRSWTSPVTPATTTPGPLTSTSKPEPAAIATPTRAHPGPGLASRDLALLAGPHPLRPRRYGSYQRLIAKQA